MKNLLSSAVLFTALVCVASETRLWTQSDQSDFEKGSLAKLSLSSDGRLSVGPAVREIFDSSTPYLWTVVRDSKGVVYAGGGSMGGSTAKLFRIDGNSKAQTIAELEGMNIQALAVDRLDTLYAATSPDGKVYRIRDGKPEVFYEPKTKYIWALAFSGKGDLYVATGDQGEIHRVTPTGAGSVFFRTEETHARSLVLDASDNLIVGTDPSGLILRVSPAGDGFVLYQSSKREITALAIAPNGSIYASGVGLKQPTQAPVSPLPSSPSTAPQPAVGAVMAPGARPVSAPPPTLGTAPSVTGGSEVYRVQPDGHPRRIWSHSTALAYALAFDAKGRLLVGTGNRGEIFRLDSDRVYTLLTSLAPTQVTGFATGPRSGLYVATGNIGKLFTLGPELEPEGSIESDVFDAGGFTYWGRLRHEGTGTVTFETRSGNLSRTQKNWSLWVPLRDGRVASPAARFLQYRAKLTSGSELTLVETAHLMKNVAPSVDVIEVTPANYRFPPSSSGLVATPSLTLPAIGQKKSASASSESSSTPSMNFAKGWTGARWTAADENGDTLLFNVEIRGVKEHEWRLLKEKIRERYFTFDSSSFADGEYVLRVTASDGPSNPPEEMLSGQLISDRFLIDNTAPSILDLRAHTAGGKVELTWRAKDALSVLEKAEYSVNGGEWIVVEPTTKLTDSPEHRYKLSINRAGAEMVVAVRVSDQFDNQSVEKVVVK